MQLCTQEAYKLAGNAKKKKRLYCQQVSKGILSWWFRESELFFHLRKWNETISWEKCPYSSRRNS